ncbi:hypothetical protein [Cytobacillus oceanisediminis]|uniref:hypothetical protein n=1 Tax=Cytobacillus oceanisediminis TaxID=665099 RepID=UPI002040C3CB|nr:hypothetical protein [Cytobacillus oceanisediminis]MCM3405498.1 hypothetical protein [Cytobacillus oceanisediminis]
MSKKYRLTEYFHNEGYGIDIFANKKLIEASDREEALKIAGTFETGKVFYDSNNGNFIYQTKDELVTLDEVDINYCEVFSPRKDYKHEVLMGSPVFDKEDFKPIRFNELIRATYKEAIECNKDNIYFESLAYGVEEI